MNVLKLLAVATFFFLSSSHAASGDDASQLPINITIDDAVGQLMQEYKIAGMAIAITINGERYFYDYGAASKTPQQSVTRDTLFEVGSISKTFTATLAAYAEVNNQLSLFDSVSKHLPSLRGSSFDKITLLNLGTHTSGGLPLEVPEGIDDLEQVMGYFKSWKPSSPAGTYRSYSNLSIGMLGMITAQSMGMPFDEAMEQRLFPELGLKNTYIHVPAEKMDLYAQGYNKADEPVRVNPGVFADEAYGIKTSAVDLTQFLEANMQVLSLNGPLQTAINNTHIGYYKSGVIIQALVWDVYPSPSPVALETLLAGNSSAMALEQVPTTPITSLLPPSHALLNKTGSTNGFGAYVLFVPSAKIGIVILANKNYPNAERVKLAHLILAQLAGQTKSTH